MSAVGIKKEIERNGWGAAPGPTGRPRVLHLINSFDVGGTERQAVELLNRLDRQRFDVRLAALGKRGPLLAQIAERYPVIHEFPLTSFYNANAARQLMRLRRMLIDERIDVVHAHDFYAGMLGVAAARMSGTPIVAAQRHLRLSDRRLHDWGTRFIHKFAHRVLVNSEAIRDYIIEMGSVFPGKITVIHNGLNVIGDLQTARRRQRAALLEQLQVDPQTKFIGSVAGLKPVKGHRYLLQAGVEVMRTEPHARLVFVGDGESREEIVREARELGVFDRLHLVGDRRDAALLVAGFDVAVLASLHEGLPNTVMEAMAAAVPVVATAVGGTTELITDGETGFLVPPADAGSLAERIAYVLANPSQSELIALRGQRSALDRFGMQRMVSSVESLYEEMAQGAR